MKEVNLTVYTVSREEIIGLPESEYVLHYNFLTKEMALYNAGPKSKALNMPWTDLDYYFIFER